MSPTAWICGQLSNGNGEIKSETTANARLIAAAPELLDALKGVTRILEAFRSTHQFGKTQTERLEKARAIVAKAEGQKGEP
jgi:hypothetical protein